MIDLIIAYLALIVVILLFIIVFLTFYLIYERRKFTQIPMANSQKFVVPLLNFKASGDHSNSAMSKRLTKRLRYRPRTVFLRRQNSQGFLPNKFSNLDQTIIHFSNE